MIRVSVEVEKNIKSVMELKLGVYKHFKGKEYEVIGMAKHSETLEEMVVYRALYGEGELWVRPLKNFIENVTVEGKTVPRFKNV
jgi:cyclomaltodextrinase / maltogenic alpha-amylase / neopullulanase